MRRKPTAKRLGWLGPGLDDSRPRRRGLSLLEMMVATAMMATLMASVVVVMRSGLTVWNAQEADIDVLENGYGVLRHFVQQMRQADSVTAISIPSDTTGDLTFLTATGVTRTWTHNGGPNQVYFNNGTSNQLLANSINTLTFIGYEADGATQTTVVNDIQVVQCAVQITLPHGGGVTRTLTSRAWIRTW
jgi:prepilin-type N-terminal cleavage/methylation domain-containing protein